MEHDILAALSAGPKPSNRKCKFATLLDAIPDDTPGKADLVAAAASGSGWGHRRLSIVMGSLGMPVSSSSIGEHRSQLCICFGG